MRKHLSVAAFSAMCMAAVFAPSALAGSTTGLAPQATSLIGSSTTTTAATRSHGVRRLQHAGVAPHAATAAPAASGTGPTPPTTVPANFDGVSSRDSEVTNFGLKFEPPDQGLCAGNGFVVEMVNSAYTIYRPDGSVVQGPLNVTGPFNVGGLEFTSDPRCYFDPSTQRWFATILFLNDAFTKGKLFVAVSQTADPTKVWKNYSIDTTDPSGANCPCFGDQPTLGIDRQNVYVTTAEFGITSNAFHGAQLYAIAKQDLVSGANNAHFVHFSDIVAGGQKVLTLQPAINNVNQTDAEYFINSLDAFGTGDNRLAVWALTNVGVVASGGTPTLSKVLITTERYAIPPQAEQKGSSALIDSGDDRMEEVQQINGTLWSSMDTAVGITGDPVQRAGAAWFQIRPTLNAAGTRIASASVLRQGYVTMAGNYVLYPSLEQAPSGTTVMGFSLTGPNRYPSTGYAALANGAGSFGAIKITGAGTGPYRGGGRWGDYSWANLDGSDLNTVWLADEYVPPLASQTSNRLRNWGTRVWSVDTTP